MTVRTDGREFRAINLPAAAFTVTGYWVNGEPVILAVYPGEHSGFYPPGGELGAWGLWMDASDPEEAAELAAEDMRQHPEEIPRLADRRAVGRPA
jgi:hypothetical protein